MSTAISRLAETAKAQERQLAAQNRRLARIREQARVSTERVIGSTLAVTAAAVAGAVNGAFDLSKNDQQEGDGAHAFGLPVTPIVGAGLSVLGMFEVVPGGYYVGMAGIGMACEFAGHQARKRAAASDFAQKRREKFG